MLGLVVPFGLLPASDPRVIRSAEWVIRNNTVSGDPNALARWTGEASQSRPEASNEAHLQDASSLATLWMARYMIQLGRETGQGRHWGRAIAMIDGILSRLLPLGLNIRTGARLGDPTTSGRPISSTRSGSWALHALLIEALLDLAGLDYLVVGRLLTLNPVLPTAWPQTGITQVFPCGEVSYRLERPIGGTVHQLTLRASLKHPVTLQVGITSPGLTELGPWQSSLNQPAPVFQSQTARMSWTVTLPAGEHTHEWTWG